MRVLMTVFAVALLGGCSTFGMSAAKVAEMDQNKCAGYGFKPGTDAYASCMQQIALSRAEDDRQRSRGLAAFGAAMLNDDSVTCNTSGSTFGRMHNSTTTCR